MQMTTPIQVEFDNRLSAIIIEDKAGLKRNSLFENTANQMLASVEDFSFKITAGKQAQITGDFMIIARLEGMILGQGVDETLERAEAYLRAGSDGVMIHSKERSPATVLEFCAKYAANGNKAPIVVVPSTYSAVYESELRSAGASIVIYANHLLRAAYPAMVASARSILEHGRCEEANPLCMPIAEILHVGGGMEKQ